MNLNTKCYTRGCGLDFWLVGGCVLFSDRLYFEFQLWLLNVMKTKCIKYCSKRKLALDWGCVLCSCFIIKLSWVMLMSLCSSSTRQVFYRWRTVLGRVQLHHRAHLLYRSGVWAGRSLHERQYLGLPRRPPQPELGLHHHRLQGAPHPWLWAIWSFNTRDGL